MATPVATTPIGALIADYLWDAEAGSVRDPAGGAFSPASLRSLRRSFALVEGAAPQLDTGTLAAMDDADLQQLGRHILEHARLPPSRLGSVAHALRLLSAYAGGRAPAGPSPGEPLQRADPPRGTEPRRRTDPSERAAVPRASPPDLLAAPEARTPTYTMLALGAHVSAWIERILVIAFVLTAIGLALELL